MSDDLEDLAAKLLRTVGAAADFDSWLAATYDAEAATMTFLTQYDVQEPAIDGLAGQIVSVAAAAQSAASPLAQAVLTPPECSHHRSRT